MLACYFDTLFSLEVVRFGYMRCFGRKTWLQLAVVSVFYKSLDNGVGCIL